MPNILILFAHPAYQRSKVNRALADEVKELAGVTFRDLYEEYPVLDIDTPAEQKLLEEHDIIILQHPFFWYSTPAILKEWQDLVLEHGWAYGSTGNALAGKKLMNVITTGGGGSAYQKDGYNRFTIRQLLCPMEQTAHLCGMEYLPPFAVHGTHLIQLDEINAHARRYRDIVVALRDGTLDWNKVVGTANLDIPIEQVLTQGGANTHAE